MKTFKLMAHVASFFSVIFSCSIIMELSAFLDLNLLIDKVTLILSSAFMIAFLISNEVLKVKQLYKLFNKEKYSTWLITLTFITSFGLSSFGIYFWTDKSSKNEMIAKSNEAGQVMAIENKYAFKIDSISNIPLNSIAYDEVLKGIKLWSKAVSPDWDQRKIVRKKIMDLQKRQAELEEQHKKTIDTKIKRLEKLKQTELSSVSIAAQNGEKQRSRNQFVFLILFTMVTVTEFMIGYIQYMICNFFSPLQKQHLMVTRALLFLEKDTITVENIQYHKIFNPTKDKSQKTRDKASDLWFILGELNILGIEDTDKNIVLDKENGYEKLKNYYSHVNRQI